MPAKKRFSYACSTKHPEATIRCASAASGPYSCASSNDRQTSLKQLFAKIPRLVAAAVSICVLLVGFIILLILAFTKFDGKQIWFEFVRDLGIAFTVAGVVACLFEIYHYLTHELRTMREVIDTIMGDKITPEV